MELKGIGAGVSDFKKIISSDIYYFDKTRFIEDILKDKSDIKLFTRPRRFGKTLTMSMIKYFFDVKDSKNNRNLFKDLYIEKSKYFEKQGQHPVLYLTLKDLKSTNWEGMLNQIRILISRIFKENKKELELEGIDKIDFESLEYRTSDIEILKNSLKFIIDLIYQKYNKKVILLIDEYDNPLVEAYTHEYYEEAKNFFSSFYGLALKDNIYLEQGIITGIIKAVNTGIFSELNNLKVYTILNDKYGDSFGFTESEVIESMNYYGYTHKIDDVRNMYDGYKIGNSLVYNPWSIINFLQEGELKPYWVRTSGNKLISDVLEATDKETLEKLEKLFKGESILESISETSDLSKLLSDKDLWELMLFSGYLTVDKNVEESIYELKIPNEEVRKFFSSSFIENTYGDGKDLMLLFRYLNNDEIDKFEELLQSIIMNNTSFNDTKEELFYQGLMIGLFAYLRERYYIHSNTESGQGRYDATLEPKNIQDRAYIYEFKKTKDKEKLEKEAQDAIEQIIDKKYDAKLIEKGIKDIKYVAIAFSGKDIRVKIK
ncbi:AAA family ATPase [Pseudostreptobacillus hongkongensis]|uniref:AAA family ATPase n=1 Tax=Pseudostreptobacillus hongkongensis TaxID=1162717 RepID=UPI0008310413|nr:AAA family ATPase [Pseudostreptobacillus hongkongensis]